MRRTAIRVSLAWLVVPGLASVFCEPVYSATYYVDQSHAGGSDENPGSEAKPLRTVQKAADIARAGDTILVRSGVYREHVVLRFSGRQGKPIVLKNYPGEHPVIQPGELGKEPPGHSLLLQAEEGYQRPIGWITIEGLEIRYGWDGVKIYNTHDIIIRNCSIHENWNQGILGNGNRVLIDRNIIAGNGTNKEVARNLVHGIYATGSAFTITNNLIHSNTAYGIQVAAYDYKKDSMAGPEYAEAKDWLIANNTIALNKNRAGIVIWQDGVENCIVQNNIFYKNGGVNGILFYTQENRRHKIRNNIFYPPGENLVSTEDNAYQATDNKQVDPCFVDVDSFDFQLKADSPAIDAGAADRAPRTDFDGRQRPRGSKVDIGAYEFSLTAGPLRVHPSNRRYFTDGTKDARGALRVVYLTGSHTWTNLQDVTGYKDLTNLAELGGFKGHLEWLHSYNHNFIRLWILEHAWDAAEGATIAPLPWPRTGPGNALDGKPKFDLTKFDPAYFERLRSRVAAAGKRGFYVSIMLFDSWSVEHQGTWKGHPFHASNNVNGINGDPDNDGVGTETHMLKIPAVTRLQEAYARKMVDTVNDLDNVLYEISNESEYGADWHNHLARVIHDYEENKPKHHPVGITGGGPTNKELFSGPADWISPTEWTDPPASDGRKVVIIDTDHIGHVDRTWVWRSFLRGHNPILMDWMHKPSPWYGPAEQEAMRKAMGQTRKMANRMGLAEMTPRNDVASTAYCLAHPGREYLVYQPKTGEALTIELKAGRYQFEWINPTQGQTTRAGHIEVSDGSRQFKSPFDGDSVLYLKSVQ
ncbi:MAG: right-handed parallel beta-helix repeat-containing protein [Sedimentisphaerales bacterium]|nr:right-handed parallel beta-helix repeat-containing protein [Sedimentisphaerales bacterium]